MMAMGPWAPQSGPPPNQRGTSPAMVQAAVRKMGRKRRCPAFHQCAGGIVALVLHFDADTVQEDVCRC